ncbi:hypothetical protein INT47_003199 [Mucor saturninus]|uniref:Mevalonate kinase n=2 Tax=Mucor TaxID=4830 RepID=A0A8H7RFV5_9FUNG|nr:hypothetical protein INT47_003199 [Mucor saturninus]
MTATDMNERILVSAPGKVILFGEHSVVYQKTAVAASLGLKSYLFLERRQDNIIELVLPDVNVDKTWELHQFPLRSVDFPDSDTRHPTDMPTELKSRLDELTEIEQDTSQRQAVLAFLYLLIMMEQKSATPLTHGFTLCVRSFLPVGAGLGSSASYSVAVATALLILFKEIPSDFTKSAQSEQHLEKINTYAFKAEQVLHGNPSGVDNAIATYGGAKSFMRGQGFATLEGFQSLRLLLTNTKVPRSTNALVAGVGEKRKNYPLIIEPMLDSMNAIALHCCDAFKKSQDKETLMDELEDLVSLNHCLLEGLGVSHPSLEKIRMITAESGLKTKLTGAGGGGCAVTFIRDDVPQTLIDQVMLQLQGEGFDCYETSVGGAGSGAVTLTKGETKNWLLQASRDTLEHYF